MTEFRFRFYADEKHITTKTFHTETVEDAYKMADDVLRNNRRLDDWACLPPKTNKPAPTPSTS